MEMRPEERVKKVIEVYGWNIRNPLERACLKHDLFEPLAKLPEAVGKMVSQNWNASRSPFRCLSKRELTLLRQFLERNVVFMVVCESVQSLYLEYAMFLQVS